MHIVYVDSIYGSDFNKGDQLSPLATLLAAYNKVDNNGIIVLQTGNGSSYGNLTVNKNVSIIAAEGSVPKIGTIVYSNGAQGLLKGLVFENLTDGVKLIGNNYGSIIVRDCKFHNISNIAISVDYLNYIAVHRNFFYNCKVGIYINTAKEVCISSNIFSAGYRALNIFTVERIDFWRNTIYGAANVPFTVIPDYNLRIIYKILTYFDIFYKRIQLPGRAAKAVDGKYDVAFNIVDGPSFHYGIDYTVIGNGTIVSWEGYELEGKLNIGDYVRIMYSEDEDIIAGEAIRLQNIGDRNSRIDSNSLSGTIVAGVETPIDTGILSNTPVKVRYNNFDLVNIWWSGFIPTGNTGINNIGETALYVDPNNNNFNLQPLSPNIDKGDPDRWNNILAEIGVTKINEHYTASYTGIRENISPFDKDIDYYGYFRGVTGSGNLIGDIGAIEYNTTETSLGSYVGEFGYDKSYPGSETAPYFTLDRGFEKVTTENVYVLTNTVPIEQNGEIINVENNVRQSRYLSKNLVLNNAFLVVGKGTKDDLITIYQSNSKIDLSNYKYVSMSGDDITGNGTISSPYRTISRALEDHPKSIVVEPGVYPTFKGETGVNLISIEKLFELEINNKFYEIKKATWTGMNFKYLVDGLNLLGNSEVVSVFNMNGNPDIKFMVNVNSTKFTSTLFNNDNRIFVSINKEIPYISYGYSTGDTVYHINYPLVNDNEYFSNIKIRFLIKQDRFYIYIRNKYIDLSYNNFFTSGSLTNWKLKYSSSGSGQNYLFNMNLYSDDFLGVTGIDRLFLSKKVFSIYGETGINNG